MPLSDTTKRKFDTLIGIGSADEILSLTSDVITADAPTLTSPTLTSPTLTGTIQVGAAADSLGFFGAAPTGQPAGADQGAAPPPTAVPLTYVGTPDNALGDSGNMDDNNRLASLANQINNLINDFNPMWTLLNQLRADLVDLGLIKGGPLELFVTRQTEDLRRARDLRGE